MTIDYQRPPKRKFRRRRLFVILACAVAACLAVPVYHWARPHYLLWRFLREQSKCLEYDGHNAIVYAATRRIMSPEDQAKHDFMIDTDVSETVSAPNPDCLGVMPYSPLHGHFIDRRALADPGPGPILAMHDRLLGGNHYLMVLGFSRGNPILEINLFRPATSADPRPIEISTGIDPSVATNATRDGWPFLYNTWTSLVLHSAVMDPVDQTHFTIEMVVDGHPVICDCYVKEGYVKEGGEDQPFPHLFISARVPAK